MKQEKKKRPRPFCKNCKNNKGLIRKYGVDLCRRCFKEFAPMMGFKKYE
ncbi:MAG: 30S ribosomal protein S14 [Candidatus Diapherotrites archaeon]|nr:30S ribosomal protein S14 [Candidatus Diapherotrites archaeon]